MHSSQMRTRVDGRTYEGNIPLDRIRLTWQPPDWDHESTVQVTVVAKGERTRIGLHQERLADADERERQRAHWAAVMDRLVAALPT